MSPPVSTGADRILPWLTWRQLAFIVLGFLGLILLWTRFRNLGQSFWHDEAYTALYFAGQGPDAILAYDSIANSNNHVLFNLLAWATGALVAPTEGVYRAWSVVPGAAAAVLATWWAWRRLGVAPALILATLIVGSPLHADQTSYARGYGLAILAAVAMIIGADALARRPTAGRAIGLLAVAAVGVATLYSFALVAIGHVIALLAQPRLRRPLFIAGGLAVLAAVFLFGPAIEELSENRPVGVDTISLFDALRLESAFEAMAFLGAPSWFAIPALAVAAYAAFVLARNGERELMLNLVLPPLIVNLVFSLVDAPDELRYQLIVLPHVLLLLSVGLGAAARAIWAFDALRPVAAAAGIAIVVLLCFRMVEREEVGQDVPLEDPRAAVQLAERSGIEAVFTDSLRPQGLQYYAELAGRQLTVTPAGELERELCSRPGPFVYVHHVPVPLESIPPYLRPLDTSCLERRGAISIEIPQRQRAEPIVVWLMPEDPGGVGG